MAVPALNMDQWENPKWRLNNLYKILDEKGDIVDFRMNDVQERLYDSIHGMDTVLKARQLGMTSLIQLIMLDACVFKPNVRAGVIAHNQEDARSFFRDKVKLPYDHLPEALKEANPATQDAAAVLTFANNSSIRVGTSLRSGTFQYLHISEYGKMCALYPEKAREVRTGALNTVHAGQYIFVESTAEGREGHFYEMCKRAQSNKRRQTPLTALDFRFHFFPWFDRGSYRLTEEVTLTRRQTEYFAKLATDHKIILHKDQMAWYVKKAEQQGEDMLREFPSTWEEAFQASIEGAYYEAQFRKIDEDGRIGKIPHDTSLKVDTWWDLGMADSMAIWFAQRHGKEIRLIDHYEASGEGLAHYAAVLETKAREDGYVYGMHAAPHDIKVRELSSGKSRLETARTLGIDFEVCSNHAVSDGIEAVRNVLGQCWFDEQKCADGIQSLRSYRKEWNDKLGTWSSNPRHDRSSHSSDSFRYGVMCGASDGGYYATEIEYPKVDGIV